MAATSPKAWRRGVVPVRAFLLFLVCCFGCALGQDDPEEDASANEEAVEEDAAAVEDVAGIDDYIREEDEGDAVSSGSDTHVAPRQHPGSADLSHLNPLDLNAYLIPFGYDTCVEDGGCDACLAEEVQASYCAASQYKQDIICAECRQPNPPEPFCLPGSHRYWSAPNRTTAEALRGRARATAGASNSSARRAALFFRSCRPGNLNRTSSSGDQASMSSTQRDESAELLCFACFNAVILGFSCYSLHKQQHAEWQQSVQGFSNHVAGGTERKPSIHRVDGKNDQDRRNNVSAISSAGADLIGRSIENLATAAAEELQHVGARAATAVEMAVFGNDGQQKTK